MERKVSSVVKDISPGTGIVEWLGARFPYCGGNEWKSHIACGRITLNGKTCGESAKVALNDRITFDVSGINEPDVPVACGVVYESDGIMIVDKPPLLPVHPSGRYFSHTLWSLLKAEREYVHIATRLDRETSGLVVVCTDKGSTGAIAALQGTGGLGKEYLSVVHGDFPPGLEAAGSLVRDEKSEVRKKRKFVPDGADGESCSTSFSLLERKDGMSLVKAVPATGRTHQIRATLHSLGFPVAGDKLYGLDDRFFLRFSEGALAETDRTALVIPFQALHCEKVSFVLSSGREVSVSAPPPREWERFGFKTLLP